MIHYLPLERLESRYTTHLDDQITEFLVKSGRPFRRYYPDLEGWASEPPPPGCFLNARATLRFKAAQLAELWAQEPHDGDVIFASDLWFPGLEGVGYYRDFTGRDVRLQGLLHAGSFTDADPVRNFEWWASHFETALLSQCDRIFVASHYQLRDVCSKRLVPQDALRITPWPLDPALRDWPRLPWHQRPKRVLFAGRLAPDKQPWLFDALESRLAGRGYEFVRTLDVCRSHADYLNLVASSRVMVSFALQESFGFACMEAAALGCVPVMPDRLVYPELWPDRNLYSSDEELDLLVEAALDGRVAVPPVSFNEQSLERWFACPPSRW